MDQAAKASGEGGSPEVPFRSGTGTEVDRRRVSLAAWKSIWAASGIAYGYHAPADSDDTRCLPSHPSHVIRGVKPGLLKVGDIVSVLGSGPPSNANQHLRKVVETSPPAEGRSMGTALLGSSIPRGAWPAPMRDATVAVNLEVEPDGDVLRILQHGAEVAVIPVAAAEVDGWHGAMVGFIRNAARSGAADGLNGRTRGFRIRGAMGPEGRTWDVVDTGGTVHARDERGLLQRRPHVRVEALLVLTRAAYLHAFDVAREEDRDRDYAMQEASLVGPEIVSESEYESTGNGFGR